MHQGSCHCGAVKYRIDAPIERAIECNCSICSKKGYLLAFAPKEQFHLDQGEDALADYQFGPKTIHHRFCKNCGAATFGYGVSPGGAETVAINVRCVEGLDLKSLQIDAFDGKSL